MSVLAISPFFKREFAGYDDPSLPQGIWQGQVSAVGDASGGIQSAAIIFNDTNAPRDPNFYSLDEMSASQGPSVAGAVIAFMSLLNMGGSGLSVARSYATTLSVFNGTDVAMITRAMSFMPIFLGRQTATGANTNIQFVVPNDNGSTLVFSAMGYWWGPRSINAPGGPSRPLQGIFSG